MHVALCARCACVSHICHTCLLPAAQLYDTCPIPNLPRNPPKPGCGPTGKDPLLLLPPKLSPGALQQAVSRGLVVQEQNETMAANGTTGPVQKTPELQDVGGRRRLAAADEAVFEQAVVSINSGDS